MCVCVCLGAAAEGSQSLEQQADGRLSGWRGASRAQTGRSYAKTVPRPSILLPVTHQRLLACIMAPSLPLPNRAN